MARRTLQRRRRSYAWPSTAPPAHTPTSPDWHDPVLNLDTHQMHHPSWSPPQTHTVDISPSNSQNQLSHPGVAATASRFFGSMRKSFTPPIPPRRKNAEHPRAAMYSTPEERHAHSTSRASSSRYLDSRPTIEQIAMGLHVSRTPHLRPVPSPLHRHPIPSPPPRRILSASLQPSPVSSGNLHDASTSSSQYRMRHSLPPPPSRSSMKKKNPSVSTLTQPQQQFLSPAASPPASVVISDGQLTQGSPRPLSSLRVRMSKFISSYRPLSLPSSLGRASSFTSSASDSTRPTTPRKAVRFSTSVLALDERSS